MNKYLITFLDNTPSRLVEAEDRDHAMGLVINPVASCEICPKHLESLFS